MLRHDGSFCGCWLHFGHLWAMFTLPENNVPTSWPKATFELLGRAQLLWKGKNIQSVPQVRPIVDTLPISCLWHRTETSDGDGGSQGS